MRTPTASLFVLASLLAASGVADPRSHANDPGVGPDLRAGLDVAAWLRDYRKADNDGREALLKRWLAQTRGLVEIVRRCRPEDRDAAKGALADLWQRDRLTAADRAATVATLVTMSVAERAGGNAATGHRELVLRAERDFAFPKGTWLEWSYTIAVGGGPQRLVTTSGNSRDWEGAGPLDIGSYGGGGHFGAPTARAVVEVREVVRGRVAWRHTFAVGPTRLSPFPPPGPER